MPLPHPSASAPLQVGDLRVEPSLDEITRNGRTVKIERKAMQLLLCLARNPGRVVSVDELLEEVWKGVIVSQDSVYAAVAALRRTLGDDPKNPTYIANVARRGYRLIAPVSVIEAPSAGAGSSESAASAAPDKPSIAVLPFVNLGESVTQDFFSDGFTEDIITELSRWRLLAVRSRSASFRFRGPAVDLAQAARELNVRYIVEGSVRRLGDAIRVHAQLIDATTSSHVWAEKFDRPANQFVAVQDQIVQTIVSTLVGRVQVDHAEQSKRKAPESLAAYECVLRGNALSWDDPAGAAEATRLFEKAIELDPGYGLAYALLSAMRIGKWELQSGDSPAILEDAYRLAQRAVELDDRESTCHSLLGHACLSRRDFDLALRHVRRAVELNPNNQWTLADMATLLMYLGEAEQALQWGARAREADPHFETPWFWRQQARSHLLLGHHVDALAALERIAQPTYLDCAYMAGCHAHLGNAEPCIRFVSKCLASRPDFSIRLFFRVEPFRNKADADAIAHSMRLAGLPE